MAGHRARCAAAWPRGAFRRLHAAVPGVCRRPGVSSAALPAQSPGEVHRHDRRRGVEPPLNKHTEGSPMICDVHAHYTPKNFSEFMGDRFASPTHLAVKRGLARHPFSDTQEDIEARFRLMEDAGVGRQVLSPNHPPYLPNEAECVTAVKMLNDAYAEFARRYPDRISSYVMLPLPHVDASLKEMERGFDELGCVGVNMNIVCLGRSIA